MSRPLEPAPLGVKFGRLLVTGNAEPWVRPSGKKRAMWLCKCDCGTETPVLAESLKKGATRSCGCLQRENGVLTGHSKVTHGESGSTRGEKPSPEYVAWKAMIQRCEYPKAQHYDRYGGSGIRICSEWRSSFETFLRDMGRKPSKNHSLDRFPDQKGNYEPGNCRWATRTEQSRNRSNVRLDLDAANEIRRLQLCGFGKKAICESLGLSLGAVVGVMYGNSWSDHG